MTKNGQFSTLERLVYPIQGCLLPQVMLANGLFLGLMGVTIVSGVSKNIPKVSFTKIEVMHN